jgi:hypothetical protein
MTRRRGAAPVPLEAEAVGVRRVRLPRAASVVTTLDRPLFLDVVGGVVLADADEVQTAHVAN